MEASAPSVILLAARFSTPAAGLEHQDDVRRLRADLPADAAPGQGNEARVAPAAALAHRDDTLAPAATDHETGLDHARDHRNAVGIGQQFGRDGVLRYLAELMQHVGSGMQAIVLGLAGTDGERPEQRQAQQQRGQVCKA
jgi:hypothetical protein